MMLSGSLYKRLFSENSKKNCDNIYSNFVSSCKNVIDKMEKEVCEGKLFVIYKLYQKQL